MVTTQDFALLGRRKKYEEAMSDEHSQPVSSSFSLLGVLGDDGSYNYPNLADPHFVSKNQKNGSP